MPTDDMIIAAWEDATMNFHEAARSLGMTSHQLRMAKERLGLPRRFSYAIRDMQSKAEGSAPSPAEIKARAAEVRGWWSEEEEEKRQVGGGGIRRYSLPRYAFDHNTCAAKAY